jgi:hypothetical protein
MFNANQDFENWVCSYSGCEGGNINGQLWFCGIEWGGGAKADWLRKAVDGGPVKSIGALDSKKDFDEQLTYQFDQKLLKIYATLCGSTTANFKAVATERGYLSKSGQIFKMNLYPVPFGNTNEDLWSHGHYEITGMPTKSMYKGFCQAKRFPLIHGWVREHNPKVIICAGQTLYMEYVMAYCGYEAAYDVAKHLNTIDIVENRKVRWAQINDDKTLLVVTPFFGNAYGLNSDAQLEDVGRQIRRIGDQLCGQTWL